MVKRKNDAEVLSTLYDALQAWKRGDLGEGAVCMILQMELEPSVMTDKDREWARLQAEYLPKHEQT